MSGDRIIRNRDCDLSRYKFGKLEKEYENITHDALFAEIGKSDLFLSKFRIE